MSNFFRQILRLIMFLIFMGVTILFIWSTRTLRPHDEQLIGFLVVLIVLYSLSILPLLLFISNLFKKKVALYVIFFSSLLSFPLFLILINIVRSPILDTLGNYIQTILVISLLFYSILGLFYWVYLFVRGTKGNYAEKLKVLFLGLLFIAVLVLAYFLFSKQVFSIRRVSSESWMTGLKPRQSIGICMFCKYPPRGSVVLYKDSFKKDLIGRVIGLPNEKIAIEENNIFINDNLFRETYAVYSTEQRWAKKRYEFILNNDEYFIFFDQRRFYDEINDFLIAEHRIKRSNILGTVIQRNLGLTP